MPLKGGVGGSRRVDTARLDMASRFMWGGLGVLLVALVVVAVRAKSPAPQASPTAPLANLTRTVDGVACSSAKTEAYHAYAHLDVYLRGRRSTLPADIGVFAAQGTQPACQYALTTQDTSGVIHIAAPQRATYTLGQFFAVWGMPLGPKVLMGYQATSGKGALSVRAYVDGRRYSGDPRSAPLSPNASLALEYGPPWVSPAASYRFPSGE